MATYEYHVQMSTESLIKKIFLLFTGERWFRDTFRITITQGDLVPI